MRAGWRERRARLYRDFRRRLVLLGLRLRTEELLERRAVLRILLPVVLRLLCRVVLRAFLPPIARELSRRPRAPTRDLPSRSCWPVLPLPSFRFDFAKLFRFFDFV
jgi:hypothetical protein